MTTRVLKFPLQSKPGGVVLQLPFGSQILHVGVQFGEPVLWASVDASQSHPVTRKFAIFWTGQEFDARNLAHVGTVAGCGTSQSLVCHVYEVVNG